MLLNWYFSMKKKIEKDLDNFWHRKLTLKVKFWSNFGTFDTSPLTQFSKFNNFLWVCWFWDKNLTNFVPPIWKLHNPCCHVWSMGQPFKKGLIFLKNNRSNFELILIDFTKRTFYVSKWNQNSSLLHTYKRNSLLANLLNKISFLIFRWGRFQSYDPGSNPNSWRIAISWNQNFWLFPGRGLWLGFE